MFGEDVGYMSSELKDLSEEAKAKVDQKVKQLLE